MHRQPRIPAIPLGKELRELRDAFRRRIDQVHAPNRRNASASPQDNEILIDSSWRIVIPCDAALLVRNQPLHVSDAIHLAAATRLPAPVRFVTFDPAQIPVALSLGFEVVSS